MAHGGLKRRPGRPPRTEPIGLEGASRPGGRPKKDGSVMKLARRPTTNDAVAIVGERVLPEKQRGDRPGLVG